MQKILQVCNLYHISHATAFEIIKWCKIVIPVLDCKQVSNFECDKAI